MRIINQTHWRTDHLKAILQRCAEMELEPGKRRRAVVTIVYSGKRHDSSSGCASIKGTRAKIRIPKGAPLPDKRFVDHYRKCDADPNSNHPNKGQLLSSYLAKFDETKSMRNIKLAFASVACHEFAHNRGMRHGQMPKHYTWAEGWKDYVAWVVDMPLEVQTVERKTVDAQQQRYSRVLELTNQWAAKLKRAQTALKKLKAKERYYERAFAQRNANGKESV